MSLDFTIVEIEYSGSGLRRNYLVEIAMLRINRDGSKARFHKIIKPPEEISDFVIALVDFDRTAFETAPEFEEVANEIAGFCSDSILVGLHIRFIYALMRRSFKQTGIRFVHKQICLSRLSEKACNELNIQSLGNLCRKLNIVFDYKLHLEQRVKGLSKLFEKLFLKKLNHSGRDKSLVQQFALNTKLPPNLSFSKVESLPNALGVYYFLDHKGRIIYLGKSNDIKKRVFTHFNSDLDDFTRFEMKNSIHDIQYRLTGSELVSLLLESDEIKRYMPKFNRAQRRVKYTQGIYINPQPDGFLHFQVTSLGNGDGWLLMKFPNKWRAVRFILHAAMQYGINPNLCGLGPYLHQLEVAKTFYASNQRNLTTDIPVIPSVPLDMPLSLDDEADSEDNFSVSGSKIGTQSEILAESLATESEVNSTIPEQFYAKTTDLHNERVMQLLQSYSYPSHNMLIIDQGKNAEEVSVVMIANNVYAGYAYLPVSALDFPENLVKLTQEYLIPFRDNPDVQRIIRNYLRLHKQGVSIITY